VETVIVDDGSTAPSTAEALRVLAEEGHRVIRHEGNLGPAAARNTGLRAPSAAYVFPLDSDDLAIPGTLTRMADRLDADPDASVCYGDYEEFRVLGDDTEFRFERLIRGVPERLDPYRLAYTNEYPASALFRRSALESVHGFETREVYEDWDLWLTLAERGARTLHFGVGVPTYRHRVHSDRRGAGNKSQHRAFYASLRRAHPQVFESLREHRTRTDLGPVRRALYPVVYGRRSRFRVESRVKRFLDRIGVWTLRR
jgi:glycosyltransferase involved in cell wall biosynthesis